MTDPKALADEIKAAIFGSHSDPERGTTQEELLYLADQENYARHRYGEDDSDLIRESMVKEYALRVTALRRMAEGDAMREATVYPEMERDIAFAAGVEYEKKRTALQSDTPPATATEAGRRRAAFWTHDDEAAKDGEHLYYFAPINRAPSPYKTQRHVRATIDIASDGTLAGVELIDDMPPPPKSDGERAGQSPIAAALSTTLPDSEPAGSRRGGPSDLGEPVAWRYEQNCDGIWVVNYTNRDPINSVAAEIKNVVPLYASPPSPSRRGASQ